MFGYGENGGGLKVYPRNAAVYTATTSSRVGVIWLVDPADFAALAELALHDTCMSTNQITPPRDEVVAVYTAAFRG